MYTHHALLAKAHLITCFLVVIVFCYPHGICSIAPIFLVSSVTGENLHLLQKFLNLVPPLRSRRELEKLEQHHLEFQVDEVYSVPDAGTVVGGILKRCVYNCPHVHSMYMYNWHSTHSCISTDMNLSCDVHVCPRIMYWISSAFFLYCT